MELIITVYTWIKTHAKEISAAIGALVTAASVIVKITPTQKDDNALARIIDFLVMFSIFNKDGSIDGKKAEEQAK